MDLQTANDVAIRGSPPVTQVAFGSGVPRTATGFGVAQGSAPQSDPPPEALAGAVDGLNTFLGSSGSHVQFAMHEKAKELMVEIIDDRTNEVIRTIPPKELLDLAAKIGEMVGTLVDKQG